MKKRVFLFFMIAIFMVAMSFSQTITVTNPHSGDTWYKGNTYTITWIKTGDTGANVKINVFRGSISQLNFVEQLTGQNNGSKTWTIDPTKYTNGSYILRIKGVNNNGNDIGVYGDSAQFTITNQPGPSGSITVTKPSAGKKICKGNTYTITWTKSGDAGVNVKINIFKGSISQANFIEQLTGPNNGSKSWNIDPTKYTNGTYILRIKGVDNNGNDIGVHGDSGFFQIMQCVNSNIEVNTNISINQLQIQPLPDFIVYGEQLGYIDWENKIVKYHVAVKNKGQKDATNIPVKLEVYLRGNPGHIVKTFTKTFPSLPKGMTVTWDITYKLNNIGTYDFSFTVNPDFTIKEYVYTNNKGVRKTITREALPDLIVWLMTPRVDIISKSRVWVGVKNIGQKTSSPTKLKFYIQTKGTKYLDIPPIAPGKFYTAERKEWFHSLKDVWVEMWIDPYNTLREDRETNNHAKTKLKVWSHTIFDK